MCNGVVALMSDLALVSRASQRVMRSGGLRSASIKASCVENYTRCSATPRIPNQTKPRPTEGDWRGARAIPASAMRPCFRFGRVEDGFSRPYYSQIFSAMKQFEPIQPSQPSPLTACDFSPKLPSINVTDLTLSSRKIRLEA